MNNRLHWNDLQLVFAIASSGSLSAAARHLNVSHATIFRRLGSMENRLGVTLFKRAKNGYSATAAGEELAAAAREMEGKVQEVERRVIGQDLSPSGTIRVTTLDSLLTGILSPIFRDFLAAYAGIALEIVTSNQLFSLSKREADLAIRPTTKPDPGLVGRSLGVLDYAVYGRRDRVSHDSAANQYIAHPWIGPDETLIYPELDAWMCKQQVDQRCRLRVSSVMSMYAAVVDGYGLAVLPRYLGDSDARLLRLSDAISDLETELWVLTHPDLRNAARIRALLRFLAEAVPDRLKFTV